MANRSMNGCSTQLIIRCKSEPQRDITSFVKTAITERSKDNRSGKDVEKRELFWFNTREEEFWLN